MLIISQGYCVVGWGLSGLHWVWCNGIEPHLYLRRETQGSYPFLTLITGLEQESQASSSVEEWISACLSSCSRGDRPLVQLCVEPAGFSVRCTGVSGPLRVVPSSTGFPSKSVLASGYFQEWTVKLGSFDMWHHPRGYVSNFLMRPASS